MSIASEIQRLQQAKSGIKCAIESKWVTIPSDLKLQGYSDCINDIEWTISDLPFLYTPEFLTKWNCWICCNVYKNALYYCNNLFVYILTEERSASCYYIIPKLLHISKWDSNWCVLSNKQIISWRNTCYDIEYLSSWIYQRWARIIPYVKLCHCWSTYTYWNTTLLTTWAQNSGFDYWYWWSMSDCADWSYCVEYNICNKNSYDFIVYKTSNQPLKTYSELINMQYSDTVLHELNRVPLRYVQSLNNDWHISSELSEYFITPDWSSMEPEKTIIDWHYYVYEWLKWNKYEAQ